MKILGIDPGTKTLGWGVITGEEKLVGHGVLYAPDWDVKHRTTYLVNAVADLAEKFAVDAIACEAPYLNYIKAFRALCYVVGGIQLCAHRQNKLFFEVPNAKRGKALGLEGKADKARILKAVMTKFEVEEPMAEHSSDAIALALAVLKEAKK